MRKKRLLSLALVAALSVTMLAGCGGKKSTESELTKMVRIRLKSH